MKKLLYILLFAPLALFGQDNYSLSFDGVDDYIKIYNDVGFDTAFTYSVKFKMNEYSNYSGLFGKGEGSNPYSTNAVSSMIMVGPQGEIFWEFSNGIDSTQSITIDSLINLSQWYNLNVTWTSNNQGSVSSIYLNGALISEYYSNISSINSNTNHNQASELDNFYKIGVRDLNNDGGYGFMRGYFDGIIENLNVWNRALTIDEIQSYITCNPTGNENGLVAYWNFNEGSGDTVYDISGNGNHGIIHGATYSDDVPEQNCESSQSLDLPSTLNQGLIAYYPFNGNADDASANGNHGIVINATLVDDRFGATNNAYEFDADYQFTNGGSESYIQLPEISTNIGAPNSSFSISMWFSCYDPSTLGNIILNAGDGYSTIVGRVEVSGNAIKIYHRNPSTNNEPYGSINIDSNWNNVIVIVDGELGEYKLFVNGNIDNSMTFSFDANETYFNAERTWQIGGISYAGQNNHQFHGAIDDVSFWDRILTDNEIQFLSSNNILYGCTSIGNSNYSPFANTDDGSCEYLGCMNSNAINFDETATIDDEQSCIYSQDYVHGLWNEVDDGAIEYEYLQEEFNTLNTYSINSNSSLQQALDTWNTTIDLSSGWNMFGYGCPSSIDVSEGLSNHTESIIITKDNNGNVYMPEFGFNGIGDFTPGFGYQIKLTEAIEGFSLCDWYVNDIPEDNIVSLQDSLQLINSQIGCSDSLACNYDVNKLYNDGSCEYPTQGYDCEGNITEYYIGMEAEGGIVFYVDETGQHGLVAAMEDLEQAHEWGCFGDSVNGADGQSIGTGNQNTLDIVTHGCIPQNGGITAAQATLDATINGYNDWYLPSIEELVEIDITVGPHSELNNLANLNINTSDNFVYWSSTERISSSNHAFILYPDGHTAWTDKKWGFLVRPIRSF